MNIRTALRRPTTAVLLAALLAVSLALAACGGGGDEQEDATALLNEAFGKPVSSADVDVDAQVEIDGLAGFEEPLRIRATGPYVKSEDSLPQLDIDVSLDAQGAGQTIQSGILSTGDRVFLKFGGSFYEQPPEQVAQTNERLAANERKGGGSFSDLGLDPRGWVVDAKVEGDETVGGVPTEHVSGTLDVAALLTDVNGLVKQSAGSLGEAGQAARPLGKAQVERLADAVEDPTFDVYVGKDDDIVRRVSLRLEIAVPEKDRKDVGGVTGASIRLSAELDDVGGDQRVEAPRQSQPLSVLTSQIGGLDALAGGLGGGGNGGETTTPAPDAPAGGTTTDDAGTAIDDFQRYSDCLDAADPDDAQAIARCRDLLP